MTEPPDLQRTPLFRLPIYLMSLEKDYSQMLQWHIRGDGHATRCMVKVTEAAKRHALEEEETNAWMERQLDYMTKILAEGSSYEDFKAHMATAPDHPTFNLIFFIGLANLMSDKIATVGAAQHALGFFRVEYDNRSALHRLCRSY